MKIPVGLKFRPSDEEMIVDYLWPKNLDDDTSHVDQFISTVTICNFEPWELPCKSFRQWYNELSIILTLLNSESRIKLKDREWCFFSRKENKYNRGEKQVRKTRSGYWKITGKPTSIFRKSTGDLQKIGEKRVLMFFDGKRTKSDWVMHEYHLLSPDQKMMKYSICKLMFRGQEGEFPSPPPAATTEIDVPNPNCGVLTTVTQELQNPRLFSEFLDEQQEIQMGESILRATAHMSSADWDSWLAQFSQIDDCDNWFPFCAKIEAASGQEDRHDFKP